MVAPGRQSIDISVVIPVRNEENNVPELTRRLQNVLSGLPVSFEVIYVTDENTDRTVETIKTEHSRDARIKMLKLARGRGQHMAAVAGLAASQGNHVVFMDGDLQDEPEDIPLLYAKAKEGYSIVCGVKQRKNESALRNFFSRNYIRLMDYLSESPGSINTSLFRMIDRRMADELLHFREHDQDPTLLMTLVGLPQTSVVVNSGKRHSGKTNYSLLRQINVAISCIVSFSTKPLRLIAGLGFICAALSLLHLIYVILTWIKGVDVPGWATLAVLVSFLGSAQLNALGVIGEYLAHVFIESKRRPLYVVEESCGELNPARSTARD